MVREESDTLTVALTTDIAEKVCLHWGACKRKPRDWAVPSEALWPSGTVACDDGIAVDTRFGEYRAPPRVPLQQVLISVPKKEGLFGLTFVVKSVDETKWWKDGNSNFVVPFPGGRRGEGEGEGRSHGHLMGDIKDGLLQEIVECEHRDQWTLMHRFNRCSELVRDVMDGNFGSDRTQSFRTLYVWLRYSAIRQLTWQRRYNTQPRILSGAQDNLTSRLASTYRETSGEAQQWVRSMMACVGKGGNGQKIRDDILHIMHRHKIKEVKGTWMEEWHQKLHNNTTPDDIHICEAYLAFLEGGGSNQAYWQVLSDAGITRQRLETFDRAIKCEPEDFPDKREGLISDFRDYLRVLKSVHSGTDLQTAVAAVAGRIPGDCQGHLGYVLSNPNDTKILPFLEAAVEARIALQPVVATDGGKDFVYLDLALEAAIRAAAERGASLSGRDAGTLVEPLLKNLCLSFGDNTELCYCLKAWQSLPPSVRGGGGGGRPGKEEALLATAVVDRLRRALGEVSDAVSATLQPAAEQMGMACGCERWTIALFSEEVVRGSPAFAVSLVLSSFEPVLREAAELGSWQIISPGEEVRCGKVVAIDFLYKVQHACFVGPTVLIADRVTGEEEIPENCVCVITPDAPDVLSHISVRARNEKVLLATCHDDAEMDALRAMAQPAEISEISPAAKKGAKEGAKEEGTWLALQTTASGSLTYEALEEAQAKAQLQARGEGAGRAGESCLII